MAKPPGDPKARGETPGAEDAEAFSTAFLDHIQRRQAEPTENSIPNEKVLQMLAARVRAKS